MNEFSGGKEGGKVETDCSGGGTPQEGGRGYLTQHVRS